MELDPEQSTSANAAAAAADRPFLALSEMPFSINANTSSESNDSSDTEWDDDSEDEGEREEEEDEEEEREVGPVPEELLQTNPEVGLSEDEVRSRQKKYGRNQLKEEKRNLFKKFFQYFWGPIQWLVELAVVLSIA